MKRKEIGERNNLALPAVVDVVFACNLNTYSGTTPTTDGASLPPFSASVSNLVDNPPPHTVTLSQEASPRTCEYGENPSVERSHSIPRADRECLDAGVGGPCPGVTGLDPAGGMRGRDRAVDTGVYTRGSVSKRGRRPHTLSARLPFDYKSTQVGRGSVQAPFLVSVGGRSDGTPAGQPCDNTRSDDDS